MKKTILDLTDSDVTRFVKHEHWEGPLVDYMPRVTENSGFGVIRIISDGKIKSYAVGVKTEFEVDEGFGDGTIVC